MNSNLHNNLKYSDSSKEEIESKKSSEKEEYDINDNEIDYMQDLNSIYNKYHKNLTENDSSHKQKNKSSNQIKDKLYYQFINAILNDDKSQAEKILNTSQSTAMINYSGIEGFTPFNMRHYMVQFLVFNFYYL